MLCVTVPDPGNTIMEKGQAERVLASCGLQSDGGNDGEDKNNSHI